ncbi:MAG: DUF1223 domain-containing protein [Alphaproteobacteria bacterium]|nr:MAG: DUF1223 domain-containing protein [Alphaproteobacteria bacterium]
MRKWLTVVFFSMFGAFTAAQAFDDAPAAESPTVVELFTSQGCSSCPPADAALRSLRDRPGVLTLSWPVDYWDRLGWEDTFADPHNALRQAAYNKRLGRGGVFTPQMVFDGKVQCVGSKPEQIRAAIETAREERPDPVTPKLGLTTDGERISVTLPAATLDETTSVRIVWYLADAEVEIGDGENRGRLLHYTNVVRRSDVLEDWDGRAVTLSLDPADGHGAGADHVAVLLQQGYGHGPIIGAASMALDIGPKVIQASMP